MATGPSQSRDGRNVTGLGKQVSLCISPILIDNTNLEQSVERQSGKDDFNNTSLAKSALVSRGSQIINRKTSLDSLPKGPVNKSNRFNPPSRVKSVSHISGLGGYGKSLSNQGISKGAAELISKARRAGSLSNYESAWKKWSSWCGERQIDPFRGHVNKLLDYLTYLFEKVMNTEL